MILKNQTEVDNTRAKLEQLEHRYDELRNEKSDDELLRQATLRSLKRYINQFKEEIAWYEAHHQVQH
jgi:hypothetical protein